MSGSNSGLPTPGDDSVVSFGKSKGDGAPDDRLEASGMSDDMRLETSYHENTAMQKTKDSAAAADRCFSPQARGRVIASTRPNQVAVPGDIAGGWVDDGGNSPSALAPNSLEGPPPSNPRLPPPRKQSLAGLNMGDEEGVFSMSESQARVGAKYSDDPSQVIHEEPLIPHDAASPLSSGQPRHMSPLGLDGSASVQFTDEKCFSPIGMRNGLAQPKQ